MKNTFISKILLFCIAPLILGACGPTPKADPSNPGTEDIEPVIPTPEDNDPIEEVKYSFTFNGTNCTANNLSTYKEGTQVSIVITPNANCVFSSDIIVTGVDEYQFSKQTGILSLIVTNDIYVTCVCKDTNICSIQLNLDNISIDCADEYYKNSYVSLLFIPSEGYKLPLQKDVKLTNAEFYSYDVSTGNSVIYIKGDVTITASAIRIECPIEVDLFGASIEFENQKETYYMNDVLKGKVIANKQYVLPESINIVGDSELISYNPATGDFEILLKSKCIVRAIANFSPVPVTITSNLTNCSILSNKTYNVHDKYNETIIPDKNYFLPEEIEVIGLENYSYNSETGVVLGDIIGNIQITVTCIVDQSKVSTFDFAGTNCSANTISSLFIGDDFNILISPDFDYKLPESIAVSGLEEGYTYNKTSGEISGVVKDNIVSITCVAVKITHLVSFEFIGTYCSANSLTQYEQNDEIKLTITPDFPYELPNNYTATGLENISYNKATGEFSAIIVGDATLEVVATKITTRVSYYLHAYNCRYDSSGFVDYGDKVELTAVPLPGYVLPDIMTAPEGCLDFQYDSLTGKISFLLIGNISLYITAIYQPNNYSFELKGSHTTCNAPTTLVEGDEFLYTLSPDAMYVLPDKITVTGLEGMSYSRYNGVVKGTIIGNVIITCDSVFDSDNYVPITFNCTNCTILDAPEYASSKDYVFVNVLCDNGYTINNNCISSPNNSLSSYSVEFSKIQLLFHSNFDHYIVDITAIAEEKPVVTITSHCNISVQGKSIIGKPAFAFITTDEGYILPDNISYKGIELITYNKDLQTMTFRRLEEDASITITAIEGESNYDPSMTTEKMEELVYRGWNSSTETLDYTHNDFLNVSSTEVRMENHSIYADLTSDNDVIYHKNDYGRSLDATKTSIEYNFVNDFEIDPYYGDWYRYDEGKGWRGINNYDDVFAFESLSLADDFAEEFDVDNASYSENGKYYFLETQNVPTYLFFKDGRFAAGLYLEPESFHYVEFYDYDTTLVEDPEIPSLPHQLNVSCPDWNCYLVSSGNGAFYEHGYKLTLVFELEENGYEFNDPIIEGLEDVAFDKTTGFLTGTVVGNVTIIMTASEIV